VFASAHLVVVCCWCFWWCRRAECFATGWEGNRRLPLRKV